MTDFSKYGVKAQKTESGVPAVQPATPAASGSSKFAKYGLPAEQVEPAKKEGGGFKGFLKSMVSAPATILARPIQAVAALGGVSTESIDKFSREKLGGIVAPTPQNASDVMKDVGRAVETVSYGVGVGGAAQAGKATVKESLKQGVIRGVKEGAKAGAAFGASVPLTEKGTEATGTDIIKSTATGAVLGGATGAAVPVAFAGARKAFQVAKNPASVLKTPTRVAKAVDDLENTYLDIERGFVKTRKASEKAKIVTEMKNRAGTTGRAPERVLAESGIIPKHEGTKFTTQQQARELREGVAPLRQANKAALREAQLSSQPVALDDLERATVERISKSGGTSLQKETMIAKAKQELGALRREYGDAVPLDTLDDLKSTQWGATKFDMAVPQLDRDVHYAVAKGMQEAIEETAAKAGATDVAQLNREIGDILEAAKFLENLDGRSVLYGRMGTHMLRLSGAIIGSKGGPLGSLGGAMGGDVLASILRSTSIASPVKRLILKDLEKTNPEAFLKTLNWLKKQGLDREIRLALPAPKAGASNINQGRPVTAFPPANNPVDYVGKETVVMPPQNYPKQPMSAFGPKKLPKPNIPPEPYIPEEKLPVIAFGSKGKVKNAIDIEKAGAPQVYDQGNFPSLKKEYTPQTSKATPKASMTKSLPSKPQENKRETISNRTSKPKAVLDKDGVPSIYEKGSDLPTLAHPEERPDGVWYHGTNEANKKSILKTGINTKLNTRDFAEQPEAFYMSSKGEAEMYGRPENLVKVRIKKGEKVKTIGVDEFSIEQNREFKTDLDRINWAKKNGYDAINHGDEIAIVNPEKFEVFDTETKSNFGKKIVDKIKKTPNKQGGFIQAYEGEKDLTTKILTKLEGREKVSKQFISDLTNSGDIRQVERETIRSVLEKMPDNVSVKEFAEKVKSELVPLKRLQKGDLTRNGKTRIGQGGRFESITLPPELRGSVANYQEHIYESPIATSAGKSHFGGYTDNYFAHSRVEDLPRGYGDLPKGAELTVDGINKASEPGTTRRVIEIQSDLFQKGNLEQKTKEAIPYRKDGKSPEIYNKNLAQLEPYRDTWHERLIREEIKQAAKDGKTKLQFPVGETAMKIEGLGGQTGRWQKLVKDQYGNLREKAIEIADLKVGKEILQDGMDEWIIADVLGDGKFKAIPKSEIKKFGTIEKIKKAFPNNWSQMAETFDISGKIDTNNPIYRFYEKEVGRFLQSKYGAKIVTDPKGVRWFEVDITKDMGDKPVLAFGKIATSPLLVGAGASAAAVGASKYYQNKKSNFGRTK